jgi:hypothetical protein
MGFGGANIQALFTVDTVTANNYFCTIWAESRVMKQAGWTYLAGSDGTNRDVNGCAGGTATGGANVGDPWGTANPAVTPYTTVASGSSGIDVSTFTGSGTLNVASTTNFASSGTIYVVIGGVEYTITYTATSGGNSFTGCTTTTPSGSATLATGQAVVQRAMTIADTYPQTLSTHAGWWLAKGPQTVKIQITTAATGTFKAREKVSQATSGASGELLGYVFDATSGKGWLIIAPWESTPSWDTTHTITGAVSGATVNSNGTSISFVKVFQREYQFFKQSTGVLTGCEVYNCYDTYKAHTTQIASASNNVALSTLVGSQTVTVNSTTGFASSGSFYVCVQVAGGTRWQPMKVTYTSTTSTTFVNCTFDTNFPGGTMLTNQVVTDAPATLITAGSNNAVLPQATINVLSTSGFDSSGSLVIMTGTAPGSTPNLVHYTGTSGGNSFTGGTDGTGTMLTGQMVLSEYYNSLEFLALVSIASTGGTPGVTTTVGPGYGGTGNITPPMAIYTVGASTPTAINWFSAGTQTPTVHSICVAANATPSANTSADGTWWLAASTTAITNANGPYVQGFFVLDDGDPGDIDPYVFYFTNATTSGSYSQTATTTASLGAGNTFLSNWFMNGGNTAFNWNGYIARGLPSIDVGSYFRPAYLTTSSSSLVVDFVTNTADQLRSRNHPAATKPAVVDTIVLMNDATSKAMRKGRPRWVRLESLGYLYNTTDGKLWVCMSPTNTAITSTPALFLGPWDQTTVPIP